MDTTETMDTTDLTACNWQMVAINPNPIFDVFHYISNNKMLWIAISDRDTHTF